MPTHLISFKLDNGGTVFVETEQAPDRGGLVGRGDIIPSTQTFEQALAHLHPIASAVLDQITALATRPDEVTVELGVSLKAEAGVIIAKTAGEGSLKLTLKWKRHE